MVEMEQLAWRKPSSGNESSYLHVFTSREVWWWNGAHAVEARWKSEIAFNDISKIFGNVRKRIYDLFWGGGRRNSTYSCNQGNGKHQPPRGHPPTQ